MNDAMEKTRFHLRNRVEVCQAEKARIDRMIAQIRANIDLIKEPQFSIHGNFACQETAPKHAPQLPGGRFRGPLQGL